MTLSLFGDLLVTALYTAFFQNLVLSFGFGTSEMVRVSLKPKSFGMFAAMISGFSVVTSAICYPLDRVETVAALPEYLHAAVYASVLVAVYLVAAIFSRIFLKAEKAFLTTMGIAALNTLVLAVPFLNRTSAYSFAASIGSGLGAGVAFVLAAALLAAGVHGLAENKDIPEVFKGTPAVFIYVGLLSLAFSGFSGNTIFS